MKKIQLSIILVIILIIIIIPSGTIAINHNIVTVAGIIRNDSFGNWYVLDNNLHSQINIASVTATSSSITVNYSFTANKVLTFIAVPDEAYIINGYNLGASVGLNKSIITSTRPVIVDGQIKYQVMNPLTEYIPGSNIFIYGIFE